MKRDALVDSAQSALGWLEDHKSETILTVVVLVALVAIVVGGSLFFQHRDAEAEAGFGAAMDMYSAPVQQPGVPVQPGMRTYSTAAARAEAANAEFVKIANSFSSTDAGKQAQYFAGLTYMEMGNTAAAETALKKSVDNGGKNLAALAKLATVSIDRKSGRTSEAIATLQDLAAHPTVTVPAAQAKLELADIYEKTNPEEARKIYAQLKDKDSKTVAGQIAAQKLQGGQ
jgi:tetratricopeptide (TPR) repeat protein